MTHSAVFMAAGDFVSQPSTTHPVVTRLPGSALRSRQTRTHTCIHTHVYAHTHVHTLPRAHTRVTFLSTSLFLRPYPAYSPPRNSTPEVTPFQFP